MTIVTAEGAATVDCGRTVPIRSAVRVDAAVALNARIGQRVADARRSGGALGIGRTGVVNAARAAGINRRIRWVEDTATARLSRAVRMHVAGYRRAWAESRVGNIP